MTPEFMSLSSNAGGWGWSGHHPQEVDRQLFLPVVDYLLRHVRDDLRGTYDTCETHQRRVLLGLARPRPPNRGHRHTAQSRVAKPEIPVHPVEATMTPHPVGVLRYQVLPDLAWLGIYQPDISEMSREVGVNLYVNLPRSYPP